MLLLHLLTNISKLPRSQKAPCRPQVIKHIDSCKKTMSDLGLLPPGQLPALGFPLPLMLHQGSMLHLSPSYMIATATCWQLRLSLQRRVRLPPVKQGSSPRSSFTCRAPESLCQGPPSKNNVFNKLFLSETAFHQSKYTTSSHFEIAKPRTEPLHCHQQHLSP